MAKIKTFDYSKYKEKPERGVLPDDSYVCKITDSEFKEPNSGDGPEYLALTLEITRGEFKGRKFWDNLSLNSENEVAYNIARTRFTSILISQDCLKRFKGNTDKLHGKEMLAVIYTTENKTTKRKGNNVDEYLPKNMKSKGEKSSDTTAPWDDEKKGKKKGKKDKKKDKKGKGKKKK